MLNFDFKRFKPLSIFSLNILSKEFWKLMGFLSGKLCKNINNMLPHFEIAEAGYRSFNTKRQYIDLYYSKSGLCLQRYSSYLLMSWCQLTDKGISCLDPDHLTFALSSQANFYVRKQISILYLWLLNSTEKIVWFKQLKNFPL